MCATIKIDHYLSTPQNVIPIELARSTDNQMLEKFTLYLQEGNEEYLQNLKIVDYVYFSTLIASIISSEHYDRIVSATIKFKGFLPYVLACLQLKFNDFPVPKLHQVSSVLQVHKIEGALYFFDLDDTLLDGNGLTYFPYPGVREYLQGLKYVIITSRHPTSEPETTAQVQSCLLEQPQEIIFSLNKADAIESYLHKFPSKIVCYVDDNFIHLLAVKNLLPDVVCICKR